MHEQDTYFDSCYLHVVEDIRLEPHCFDIQLVAVVVYMAVVGLVDMIIADLVDMVDMVVEQVQLVYPKMFKHVSLIASSNSIEVR